MIRPGRMAGDRPAYPRLDNPMPAWVPERARDDSAISARGVAVGIALGLPMWWALYLVSAWARAVMEGRP